MDHVILQNVAMLSSTHYPYNDNSKSEILDRIVKRDGEGPTYSIYRKEPSDPHLTNTLELIIEYEVEALLYYEIIILSPVLDTGTKC